MLKIGISRSTLWKPETRFCFEQITHKNKAHNVFIPPHPCRRRRHHHAPLPPSLHLHLLPSNARLIPPLRSLGLALSLSLSPSQEKRTHHYQPGQATPGDMASNERKIHPALSLLPLTPCLNLSTPLPPNTHTYTPTHAHPSDPPPPFFN